MFNTYREIQYRLYQASRSFLVRNPDVLIDLEKFFTENIVLLLKENLLEIQRDYNEASYLYPFWQQYPPDDRGRKPRGDQFPWIEVGEHAIGDKLPRLLQDNFEIRDSGLPTGPDKRFVVKNKEIERITKGLTDTAWLFIDIKSVGPRDDFDHTVMSHNQVSGDGLWKDVSEGIKNSVVEAVGKYKKHNFYCSIPPLYILSDKTKAPVILNVIKPVYEMLSMKEDINGNGQPLRKLTVISIPNGLLLKENPAYLKKYPKLFFPGKDDKGKNPLKVRSRVSFSILRTIANWRVQDIPVN